MANIINVDGSSGVIITPDATTDISIQSNGTSIINVTSSGAAFPAGLDLNDLTLPGTLSAATVNVSGTLTAASKSFLIDHPTKDGMKLQYGSLEGPENGVYVRGTLKASSKIHLPDYWVGLVDMSTITVQLTPIGKHQNLFVKKIIDNTVYIDCLKDDGKPLLNIECYYTVYAERNDIDKLKVEF